jgi:sporulation protein YlmC with PRC-barrel domain
MSNKSARFITTNRLEQYEVVNDKGQNLGQVQNFVIDMVVGKVAFAIVSFVTRGEPEIQGERGIFGLSDKWFAIPWEILAWRPEKRNFFLDIKREVLEKAPGMDKDKWLEGIDLEWLAKNSLHYGRQPYWDNSIVGEKEQLTPA